MTTNKRVSKSTDGGFDRSFVVRKGKSIFRVSVYSGDYISLSFLYRMAQCNLPPGSHLIISGNDAVAIGLCCWQIGHLAVAIAKSIWVSVSECF